MSRVKPKRAPGEAGEAMIRRSLSTTHDGLIFRETTKTGKGEQYTCCPQWSRRCGLTASVNSRSN